MRFFCVKNFFVITITVGITLPNIGIEMEKRYGNVEFFSNKIRIAWSRIIEPICSTLNVTHLVENYPCFNLADEISTWDLKTGFFSEHLQYLKDECSSRWLKTLNEIKTLSGERQKRSATLLALGVTSILSNLVALGATAHQFFSDNSADLVQVQDDLIQVGTLVETIDKNMQVLAAEVCHNIQFYDYLNEDVMIAQQIDQFLQKIDHEISYLQVGQIPHSISFHKELINLCTSVERNDAIFCGKILRSNLFDIQFTGIEIQSSVLNVFVTVELPIKDKSQGDNQLFSIQNIGFFKDNEYYRIQASSHAVILKNKTFSVKPDKCANNFALCDINALTEDNCIKSFFQPEISDCEIRKQFTTNDCYVQKVNGGNLLSIKTGLFLPSNKLTEKPIEFNNSNVFFNKTGILYCGANTYTLDSSPVKFQSKLFSPVISSIEPLNINDLGKLNNIFVSNEIKINRSLERLKYSSEHSYYKKDDKHIFISIGVNVGILLIIFVIYTIFRRKKFDNTKFKYNVSSKEIIAEKKAKEPSIEEVISRE